jgi:hypothetical protein
MQTGPWQLTETDKGPEQSRVAVAVKTVEAALHVQLLRAKIRMCAAWMLQLPVRCMNAAVASASRLNCAACAVQAVRQGSKL